MADSITPTQPSPPSLPVDHSPEDERQHKKNNEKHDHDPEQQDDKETAKRPHQGLFDEYV